MKKYKDPFFAFYNSKDGLIWFRIFGYGLHIKDINRHDLLFSERVGARKRFVLRNYSIRILTPDTY